MLENILKPIFFLFELLCLVDVPHIRRFHDFLQLFEGLLKAALQNFLEELLYLRKFIAFSGNVPVFTLGVHYLEICLLSIIDTLVLDHSLFFVEEYVIFFVILNVDARLLFVKLESVKFQYLLQN